MPTNRKESIIFTVLMCFTMVIVMSFYNMFRLHGLNSHAVVQGFKGLPLGFVFAFIVDFFLVGPNLKKIIFKFLSHDAPTWKKIVTISSSTVVCMVTIMSLFGAIMAVGFSDLTFTVWMHNIPMNFIMALPLQFLVAGPLVRFLFGRIVANKAVVA